MSLEGGRETENWFCGCSAGAKAAQAHTTTIRESQNGLAWKELKAHPTAACPGQGHWRKPRGLQALRHLHRGTLDRSKAFPPQALHLCDPALQIPWERQAQKQLTALEWARRLLAQPPKMITSPSSLAQAVCHSLGTESSTALTPNPSSGELPPHPSQAKGRTPGNTSALTP